MTNILTGTISLLAATNFFASFNHGVVEPKASIFKTNTTNYLSAAALTISIGTTNWETARDVPTVTLEAATNQFVKIMQTGVDPILVIRDWKSAKAAGKTNRVVLTQGTNRIVLQRTNGPVEVSFE